MPDRMFIARVNFHAQYLAQTSHEVGELRFLG